MMMLPLLLRGSAVHLVVLRGGAPAAHDELMPGAWRLSGVRCLVIGVLCFVFGDRCLVFGVGCLVSGGRGQCLVVGV